MFDATSTSDWWKGAVIYQVYPRSFQDTTGNGTGDLKGIIARLDHIAELGADAVWISPFVRSPMLDFGYDVSDYQAVDPLFGTLEDFRSLVEKAHRLGLRIIMDQVLSHTSDQHAWFLESREGRKNSKADWYVWADAKPDGSPPNNWLSVFGGSSWQWEPRRGQYYMHNFLRQMPDLNYHCAAVQEAVLDTCRFWLDMGVDGFRLDVCTFYAHDPKFRDNPPNPNIPDGEVFRFNPYSQQLHVHDIGQPETIAFLERLRALTESYGDRTLLGELHENDAVRIHHEYTAMKRLQLAYGYALLGAHDITPPMLRGVARDLGHDENSGWPCWALDNHDFSRAITRLGAEDRPEAVTVILAALTCLRGATCLYQGSELGLPQAELARESIIDPYGREFWPAYKGRDGSRTPIPWETAKPNAGFSDADPWLPVPDAHVERAVDVQRALPGSTLNRLTQFLNWRRDISSLRNGGMDFIETSNNILAFRRRGETTITCAFNFGAEEEELHLPESEVGLTLEGHGFGAVRHGDKVLLPAYGAFFAQREAA